MQILIDNRQDKMNVDDEMINLIENVVIESLEYEKLRNDYEISISFVDNDEIKKINKQFRNIDKETDVLSFPLIEKEDLKNSMEEALGDIVISLEKAKEQSIEYNHSFKREVAFLVAHSMFHLMGYDHDNEENTKDMRKREEYVLSKLNIVRE